MRIKNNLFCILFYFLIFVCMYVKPTPSSIVVYFILFCFACLRAGMLIIVFLLVFFLPHDTCYKP